MLDLIADLGRSSVALLWVPVLLWTAFALLTETALRLFRASPDLALPLRGATLAALPAGVALPAVLGTLAPDAASAVAAVAPVAVVSLPELVVGVAPAVAPAASGPPALDVLLGLGALAFASVAGFALVRLGGAAVVTRRSTGRLASAPEAVQRRLDAMCARLGVVRPVRAVAAPPETPPFTVGWRRPVVAVPASLTGDALDLALLHEAAHVERSDYAWHAAQRAVTALFAAHPLARVLGRGLDLDRERAADAAVLDARPARRRAYADLLFSFAAAPPPPLALGATPGTSTLQTRLDAMTHPSSPLRRAWLSRAGRLGGALTLLLALGLTLTVSAQPPPPPPPPPPLPDDPRGSLHYSLTDGAPEVVIELHPGLGRAHAESVADRYHRPGAPGRVEVRYDGGVIERDGVNTDEVPPPPPPPPPAAAPAPPPPPVLDGLDASARALPSTLRLVEGLVVDADTRDPLIGANVLVVGTSAGAATAADGRFRLDVPDGEQVVRVMHSSYEPRTVRLAENQTVLDVALTIRDAVAPNVVRPGVEGARAPEIFEVAEVQPELIGGLDGIQERLVYPELQRRAGVEGQVVLQFVVSKAGRVEDVVVIRSSGNDGLDQAAIQAVAASEFVPGRQRGEPVRVRFAVPISFRLPSEDTGSLPAPVDGVARVEVVNGPALTSEHLLSSATHDFTYPPLASRAGIEGSVDVDYTLDEQGRVVETRVTEGLSGGLPEAASRIVSRLRFEVNERRGEGRARVRFSLD